METAIKNSKILNDSEAIFRRNGKIVVFGVDLSLKKGIAWALAENEKIVKTGIEDKISLVFQHIPEDCSQVIAEKMFVKKNKRVALELARAVGMLEALCEENDFPFQQILGATWQRPIKRAFGLTSKPYGMTENDWEKLRYQKYWFFVYRFLDEKINIKNLTKDQVAAACLALHGSRELRKAKILGLGNNGR